MDSHAVRHYPAATELPRWVLAGTLSGAVSVFVFQQSALALLNLTGFADVSFLWLLVLWGGIWGALLAATLARLDGRRLILGAALFGALAPTLAAVVFVAPMRGQPAVTGIVPLALLAGAFVNAAWGLGTGIGLALFGRRKTGR